MQGDEGRGLILVSREAATEAGIVDAVELFATGLIGIHTMSSVKLYFNIPYLEIIIFLNFCK